MIRKSSLVGSQAERSAVYVLPHGYAWKITRDPAGCYRGRFFRYCDLRDSAEDGVWPISTRAFCWRRWRSWSPA